jgi:hypothetical protein
MRGPARVAVRWTVGDVSPFGFEALRLSVWGAWRVFGPAAEYVVCVNSVPADEARRRTGDLPGPVGWHTSTRDQVPAFLNERLDPAMAEGVGWKFAPLRLFPDCHELALDNDCILWDMPAAIRSWLEWDGGEQCVIAEDVRCCLGQFQGLCGPAPRNSGIRGLPPGFDLGAALRAALAQCPVTLRSELDEQGMQVAAVSRDGPPLVVTTDEVTICSPFPPHLPHLGLCGAHFVGLNARRLPWGLNGRPAVDYLRDHWQRHRGAVADRVGAPAPLATAS